MADNAKSRQWNQADDLLFIQQSPGSPSAVNSRTVVGNARRWQTSRRHRDLRVIAQQESEYARSLVGWVRPPGSTAPREIRPLLPSKTEPPPAPMQDQMEAEPTAEDIALEVSGGLRIDPFNALPVDHTRQVMDVTDYWIQVWAPLKATHIDTALEYNTYLRFYWPIAQQDDMFLNAALAVGRGAWCLARRLPPEHDRFVLSQGGSAMAKLRHRISAGELDESIVFAMDFMMNIAYLTSDHAAFTIHWDAFKRVAQSFMATRPENDDVSTVVAHRLRSWVSLYEYRQGIDPLSHSSGVRLNYVSGSAPPQFRSLPAGFVKLVESGSLSVEVASVLVTLHGILTGGAPHLPNLPVIGHRIMSLLASEQLTDVESHVCHSLFALSLSLQVQFDTGENDIPAEPLDQFDTIARAFINKRLKPTTDLERHTLTWCSLVLGHVLLTIDPNPRLPPGRRRPSAPRTVASAATMQTTPAYGRDESESRIQRLRWKGHIVIVALKQEIELALRAQHHHSRPTGTSTSTSTSWPSLHPSHIATSFLSSPALLAAWRRTWERTLARQQAWEASGALTICRPSDAHPERVPGLGAERVRVRETLTLEGCGRRAEEEEEGFVGFGREGGMGKMGKMGLGEGEGMVDIEYLVLREGRESLPVVMPAG